jgi:hypothetical protein
MQARVHYRSNTLFSSKMSDEPGLGKYHIIPMANLVKEIIGSDSLSHSGPTEAQRNR